VASLGWVSTAISTHDVSVYKANANGYVNVRRIAQQPDARFSFKKGSHSYLNPIAAADMYNTFSDYFKAYPGDSDFLLTDAGISTGKNWGRHRTHNFGRSFDIRYKDAAGANIQNPNASGLADPKRMRTLLDIAKGHNFDQNYAGPGMESIGATKILSDHSNHSHIGESLGMYNQLHPTQ